MSILSPIMDITNLKVLVMSILRIRNKGSLVRHPNILINFILLGHQLVFEGVLSILESVAGVPQGVLGIIQGVLGILGIPKHYERSLHSEPFVLQVSGV